MNPRVLPAGVKNDRKAILGTTELPLVRAYTDLVVRHSDAGLPYFGCVVVVKGEAACSPKETASRAQIAAR